MLLTAKRKEREQVEEFFAWAKKAFPLPFWHVVIFLRKMESKSAGPDNSRQSREISRLRFAQLEMTAGHGAAAPHVHRKSSLVHCPAVLLSH